MIINQAAVYRQKQLEFFDELRKGRARAPLVLLSPFPPILPTTAGFHWPLLNFSPAISVSRSNKFSVNHCGRLIGASFFSPKNLCT